jgi:hypothetical protein
VKNTVIVIFSHIPESLYHQLVNLQTHSVLGQILHIPRRPQTLDLCRRNRLRLVRSSWMHHRARDPACYHFARQESFNDRKTIHQTVRIKVKQSRQNKNPVCSQVLIWINRFRKKKDKSVDITLQWECDYMLNAVVKYHMMGEYMQMSNHKNMKSSRFGKNKKCFQ